MISALEHVTRVPTHRLIWCKGRPLTKSATQRCFSSRRVIHITAKTPRRNSLTSSSLDVSQGVKTAMLDSDREELEEQLTTSSSAIRPGSRRWCASYRSDARQFERCRQYRDSPGATKRNQCRSAESILEKNWPEGVSLGACQFNRWNSMQMRDIGWKSLPKPGYGS